MSIERGSLVFLLPSQGNLTRECGLKAFSNVFERLGKACVFLQKPDFELGYGGRVLAEWTHKTGAMVKIIEDAERKSYALVQEKEGGFYTIDAQHIKGRDLNSFAFGELAEKITTCGANQLEVVLRKNSLGEQEIVILPRLEGAAKDKHPSSTKEKQPEVEKITLILAGGVSLGTYEAGALDELLYALEEINKERNKKGKVPIVIDVITGASAGSLNASLVAKRMFFNNEEMRQALYDAWVTKADVEFMKPSSQSCAFFSRTLQKELANTYLEKKQVGERASYAPTVENMKGKAGASSEELDKDPHLKLWFSLTNLVGKDRKVSTPYARSHNGTPQEFGATFFADSLMERLDTKNVDNLATWKKIAEGAIASGSFPVAFAPMFLDEAGFSLYKEDPPPKAPSRKAAYSDGGMLDNEPLEQAILLSREQDGNFLSENRRFILIDPNLNLSLKEKKLYEDDNTPLTVIDVAKRAAEILSAAAQSQAWIEKVDEVNKQVQWRDMLVRNMAEMVKALPLKEVSKQIATLSSQAQATSMEQASEKTAVEAEREFQGKLATTAARARKFYREMYEAASQGMAGQEKEQREKLLDLMVYGLNSSASLFEKSKLHLMVIGATAARTAGDDGGSFAGFFYEPWREYDYRLGRGDARDALKTIGRYQKDKSSLLSGKSPYLSTAEKGDVTITEAVIQDAPPEKLEKFYSLLTTKIDRILSEKPFELRYSKCIAMHIIKNKLRDVLFNKPRQEPVKAPSSRFLEEFFDNFY